MLVVMACTMAIAAPITLVVGVDPRVRQDVGLSSILLVVDAGGGDRARLDRRPQMVPAFQLMQDCIDAINRVLREQITGIRVVRAFVREPRGDGAVRAGQRTSSPPPSLRGGRLMTMMFPTVNLLINVSSVAVLWLGADRINDGRHRRSARWSPT